MTTQTTTVSTFVAVTDALAGGAGATVFWTLPSDLSRPAIVEAWGAEGLDPKMLPGERGDGPALHAALEGVCRAHNAQASGTATAPLLVQRTVPGSKADGYVVHTLVNERWTDDTQTATRDGQWAIGLRIVRFTDGSRDHLELSGPLAESMGEEVRAAYAAERGVLTHTTITNWLANRVIPALGGINLRAASLDATKAGGGPYYLPPDALETWTRMVRALRTSTGARFGNMPTMKSEEAVETILSALTAEIEKTCTGMEDALVEEDMGVRALRTAADRAQSVLAKVGRYEGVLSTKLDSLREMAERTIAATNAAVLVAEAAAAAAAEKSAG